MNTLVDVLYSLCTALLAPTVAGLLVLVAWSLLELGGLAREAFERRACAPAWRAFLAHWRGHGSADAFFERNDLPGYVAAFAARARSIRHDSLLVDKLVAELEIAVAGRLARLGLCARLGPMLGLMGTLIPLGPALIGLSAGELDTLARNLVVAFSTTVLGLLAGGLCFAMLQTRRQWGASDFSDIEYVHRRLQEGRARAHGPSPPSRAPVEALGAREAAGRP